MEEALSVVLKLSRLLMLPTLLSKISSWSMGGGGGACCNGGKVGEGSVRQTGQDWQSLCSSITRLKMASSA